MLNPALVIFAKQPIAGEVKTRLAKHCGEQVAADIASLLVTETVKLCARFWPGPRSLYCWPDPDHDLFRHLAGKYDMELASQCPGTLGDKMFDALLTESKRHDCAAVIGTDVPHCSGNILNRGYELLSHGKSVIGPASDGGYYFIGMQHPDKRVFEGPNWGSENVFDETIIRARDIGLSFDKLDALQDIDNWQNLVDASQKVPGLKKFLA